jgi:hypothetical protein
MATEIDAKGDLVVGTGADTFARLAVGTNDYVLTAASGETTGLKWATPAAGGMTLLASGTLSGTTTTLSSISSSYNNLILQVDAYYESGSSNSPSPGYVLMLIQEQIITISPQQQTVQILIVQVVNF